MKHKRSFFRWPVLTALSAALVLLVLFIPAGTGKHTVRASLTSGTPAAEELNIKPGTLVSNVFAFGESLSGLTVEEAVAKINSASTAVQTKRLHAISADGDKEWTATFQDLGIHLEETNATDTLRSCILSGTVLERYKMAKDRQRDPIHISPGLVFDPDHIRALITDALSSWNQEPEEATVTVSYGKVNVIGGQNGHTYDFSEGLDDFIDVLKSGDLSEDMYELATEYTTVYPNMTVERAQGYTIIGTFTTSYNKPVDTVDNNRQQNLIRSTEGISGSIFAPGDRISALSMYGAVTLDNGYKTAGTFNNGHTEEIGGGICQTTTTLYNALLRAEQGILYRRNHSFVVSYVDASMDAMVYAAGGSDFVAQNTSSDYIFLDAYVNTANCTVTVNVIGHEDHPASHQVRFETSIVSLESPGVNNIVNYDLPMGWVDASEKIIFEETIFMEPILESISYKITIDNGVQNRTQLNHDRYQGYAPTVEVAPDVRWQLKTTTDRTRNYLISNMAFTDSNKTDVADARRLISEGLMGQFNREMRAQFPGTWTAKNNEIQGRVMYGETGTETPDETTTAAEDETTEAETTTEADSGSEAETTQAPTTQAPTTEAPTTQAPTDPPTAAPTDPPTEAPTTPAPTDPPTEAPTDAPIVPTDAPPENP